MNKYADRARDRYRHPDNIQAIFGNCAWAVDIWVGQRHVRVRNEQLHELAMTAIEAAWRYTDGLEQE